MERSPPSGHHVREIRTVNLTTIGPDRCFKQGFGFKRSLLDPTWEAASAAEEAVQVVDLAWPRDVYVAA